MRTVILGATPNENRYAYFAAERLSASELEFIPVGIKKGTVLGTEILDLRTKPEIKNVHTITLYIGPDNQPEWYDYILSLEPKRIIFNPGTENSKFALIAKNAGIEIENSCTLTMLAIGNYSTSLKSV